jgi:hypothetical protein
MMDRNKPLKSKVAQTYLSVLGGVLGASEKIGMKI